MLSSFGVRLRLTLVRNKSNVQVLRSDVFSNAFVTLFYWIDTSFESSLLPPYMQTLLKCMFGYEVELRVTLSVLVVA